ncbi:protein rogdi homolog isoform X2 [Echinops telfairi]|uniref:Protein rogdi homolog isoform X2 n=1 Tax=Echinops telfairi TaxID=9371 RepID=A0AC55CNC7_ECHTE|nr:protein rogdi homolog isoform X2 [Echinops telfairi]
MATAMAATAAERAVLEEEFRWLLHDEVHAVLRQLQDILKEASLRFTLSSTGTEGPAKQENFILGSSGSDQVKGVLTLQGDALSQADVNLKMPRNNQLLHFAFREDKQWKLQQIQDARNHVSQAIYLLTNREESYQFKTGAEVLKLMDAVMLQLTRARNRLTTPATLTLPEISASGLTRMFAPALPADLLVNVYINLNKLCLTVYQLHPLPPTSTKNFRPAGGAVLHSPGAMFSASSSRTRLRSSPATGAADPSEQNAWEPAPLHPDPTIHPSAPCATETRSQGTAHYLFPFAPALEGSGGPHSKPCPPQGPLEPG